MRHLRDMPLRQKLLLMIVVTSLVPLVLVGAGIVAYEMTTFRDRQARELAELTAFIGANSASPLAFQDADSARETLATLAARPTIVAGIIFDPDGNVFAEYRRPDSRDVDLPRHPPEHPRTRAGGDVEMTNSIVQKGRTLGTLYLRADAQVIYVRFTPYAGIIIAVMGALAGGAFLLFTVFRRVLSDPILHLAGVARGVSERQDYSLRATKESEDEIGVLTGTFNTMLDRIQQRDEELKQLNLSLEARVAARTREMRESEEQFRATFEQAAVGMAHVSPDGHWLRVNQKLCDIVGYSREELRGLTFQDITHPDDLAADMAYVRRLLAGDIATYSMEKRYFKKDRSIVWINLTVALRRDATGAPCHFISVVEDITLRRRAEEELRSFFEVSLDLLCIADFRGHFLKLSPTWSKTLGWTNEELLVKPFIEFVHPDDRDATNAAAAQLAKGSEVIGFENRYRCKNGSSRWLSWNACALVERGWIIAAARDVTEQHRIRDELAHERDLLQALMDNIPDTIYFKDGGSRFTRINKAQARLLGLKEPEDAIGKTDFDYFSHAPEAFADEQEILSTGKPLIGKLEMIRNAQGERRWVSTTKMPIFNNRGRPHGIVGITRDVTELQAAREAMEHAKVELERSNTELEQLAYAASHDLQEPLRMVVSYLQLIERRYKGKLDKDADEFIGFAVDGARRMSRLINDLLDYSRVGTRSKPFEMTDCAIVLKNVLSNLKIAIMECGATITHDPMPVLLADGAQLMRVFQNLIANAIKYRGNAPPQVHVGATRTKHEWEFSVRDNGIGIDAQYYQRIFVIFQRLHARDTYEGTGIGLAVCKRIVERHGGRIWVESKPGCGSTFHFTIPAKEDNPS